MDTPFTDPMSPMPGKDPTEKFLEKSEELAGDARFVFACHAGVPCFNACCSALTLNLTPYDAMRVRRALAMPSRDFLGSFCLSVAMPGTGLTTMRLKMLDDAKRSCPFLRAEGCSIYPDRPSSCRTYPLGRATRLKEDGRVEERHFVIREPHCKGFKESASWTPAEWFADQGLEEFNRFNDLFTVLMGRLAAGPPLDPKRSAMAVLALYQPDDFAAFCGSMGLFDRLGVAPDKRAAVASDESRALEFGFAWLDMLFFKDDARLKGEWT